MMNMSSQLFRDKVLGALANYQDASPIGRLAIISQLRTMFMTAEYGEGLDAIRSVHEEWQINALLGVGLSGDWYFAIVKKKAELMGL